jgi:hypothetical protein
VPEFLLLLQVISATLYKDRHIAHPLLISRRFPGCAGKSSRLLHRAEADASVKSPARNTRGRIPVGTETWSGYYKEWQAATAGQVSRLAGE